jgi:hypothetical protein
VRVLVACSSTSTIPALLSPFRQPLPARASGALAPGPRADSTPPLRSPSQPASAAAAAARSLCPGCPVPDTFLRYRRRRRRPAAATTPRTAPAATTSPYHRLHPVPSGTRAAQCRRRCAPSPPRGLRECRRRRPPKHVPRDPTPGTPRAAAPVAAFTLLDNELPPPARAPGLRPSPGTHAAAAAALASPIPRRPRECHRRRRSWCVPRVSPPPVRPLPPPIPPLPRLLQPDDRVGIGHRHLPRHQVRALLAIVCRALPTAQGRPRALILI